ncbi:E3 CR1-delta [Human adenovirus B1]|uniref:E3 6.6kDa protein n=9 Tax=Human mastadenovirus B TaxID=108098 RepID=Q6R6I5_ADE16|nr:putative 11 kDa protein [Human adenovirus 16]AET87242.1 E3 6.6kDa protein [Human adenovirus 68]AET87324.1 E3 6.6kDa protein [Human adenovirus 16]AGT77308.1 E3 CR1-delta [Human mastadenovirus B]
MILFQSNTTNTINVQTTLNHDMENHTTSYAYTNIQPKYAMQLEITILIVIGILILSVILYFIFCRQIPNVHRNSKRRPIYSPMISRPHMALNEI